MDNSLISVKDQAIIENNIVLKNENSFQNEKNSKDIFIKKSLLDVEIIKVKQGNKNDTSADNKLDISITEDSKVIDGSTSITDVTMLISDSDRALEAQGGEETDSQYLVRTCKYCKEEKESQLLEGLLHCDGIWLHALRYEGTGWGFQAPTPPWAIEESFEFVINKIKLKSEDIEIDLSHSGGTEDPKDTI
jgi:hypothetical protein